MVEVAPTVDIARVVKKMELQQVQRLIKLLMDFEDKSSKIYHMLLTKNLDYDHIKEYLTNEFGDEVATGILNKII